VGAHQQALLQSAIPKRPGVQRHHALAVDALDLAAQLQTESYCLLMHACRQKSEG
jgi:hypothetical protein